MNKTPSCSAGRVAALAAVAVFATFGTTGCFYSTVAGFESPVYNTAYLAPPVYAQPVVAAPVVVPVVVPAYRPYYRPYHGGWGGCWPTTSLSFSYGYFDGCW